ncbi:Gfo/Idh/MocA family oxidoreductase [Microbacteriaceae bacterium VKM Ac-2854]|nr:Gfo/Idh/MocA family oxidoreductase [Microbacteriaceae bacterium VKM Ac-2854]
MTFEPLGSGTVGVAFIGAGNISDQYLSNLVTFPDVEVLIIADLDQDRAKAQAEKYGVPAFGTTEDVLAHPGVEIVINLTIPAVHAEISSAIIAAGKNVWSEKPIAVTRESALALLAQADAAGLRVGIAPDTVLGPGIQTAKRAIEAGAIGRPLFAQTSMQWQGPDLFHPSPAFLFANGGGPLFDMGPYYFTALVQIFGPIATVGALGLKAHEQRTIKAGPDAGATFPVEVPSTVSVLAQFERGGQATNLLSFDSPLFRHGVFEISGTEGTIVLPDPNTFSGRVAIVRPLTELALPIEQEWLEVEEEGVVSGRGLGVLDMARAIRTGRPHLATGELGYHVLDALVAIEESAATGAFVPVASTVEPIGSVPVDFDPLARTL